MAAKKKAAKKKPARKTAAKHKHHKPARKANGQFKKK